MSVEVKLKSVLEGAKAFSVEHPEDASLKADIEFLEAALERGLFAPAGADWGGESVWDEHPDFPVSDWKYEVENDDIRIGYREWVDSKIAQAGDEAELERDGSEGGYPDEDEGQDQDVSEDFGFDQKF